MPRSSRQTTQRSLQKRKRLSDTPIHIATKRKTGVSDSQEASHGTKLCRSCQAIDFDFIISHFKAKNDPGFGCDVLDLTHLESSSNCDLCQFLIKVSNGVTSNLQHLRLRAHSARKLLRYEAKSLRDSVIFSTFPRRSCAAGCCRHERVSRHYFGISKIGNEEDGSIAIRDTTGPVNWDVVKSWMRYCEAKHPACKAELPAALHGLKVIDCNTRKLVSLPCPGTPYVTLSYVWGNNDEVLLDGDALPKHCPQLIEDSLQLTRCIGLEYIWIDRYCVPQKPMEETKHHEQQDLLREMGRIYNSSHLTIIATAGNDPEAGIPGMSVQPRSDLTPLRIGDVVLVPARGDFRSAVLGSKWHSRGWTYQEGLHARRRLISTKGGLYLQCQQTRFLEAISIPIQLSHKFQFADETGDKGPKFFPDLSKDLQPLVRSCVYDFSRREFTHDKDVLNAFRGTLQTFEARVHASNLSGVAFYAGKGPLRECTRTDCLVNGLLWKTLRFKPRQEWTSPQGSSSDYALLRRKEFPSWSWAGWKFRPANTQCRAEPAPGEQSMGFSDAVLQVEFPDGMRKNWEGDYDDILAYEKAGTIATALHVEAWCISLSGKGLSIHYERFQYIAILRGSAGSVDFVMYVWHDLPVQETVNSLVKMVVLSDGDVEKGPFLLLREASDGGSFERIGVGTKTWLVKDGKSQKIQTPLEGRQKQEVMDAMGASREVIRIK